MYLILDPSHSLPFIAFYINTIIPRKSVYSSIHLSISNPLLLRRMLVGLWLPIMSHKRHSDDPNPRSDSDDKRRRVPSLKNVVLEVMKIQSVQHLLEPVLEPLIRRVVKEEVELALRKHLAIMKGNCGKEVHSPELRVRNLQLKFVKNLSLPVFTGARIEGEDSSTLQIALIDALTGKIVNSGPESSARVEIVVLEGDFDGDESDNWTLEEFKNNIVREREGKKPLLTGDAFLNLKDGIGLVGEISFADNSSWTRSRRFRLGARVVDNSDGTRIKEAKTEPFIVRDHRGELYKKHHPPSLFDEVWRLEKIGKDGAFHKRLGRENINSVKDFLTLLFIDSSRLRNILGTGMSAKMWEVTVEHARTCVLDKRIYLYCPPTSPQKTGVVFNVVGQLMGLLSEFLYVPIDKLSETEKVEAQHLILYAFEHWDEVVSFDNEASLMSGSSNLSNEPRTPSSPRMENSSSNKFFSSHKIGGFDYAQASASSPDIISSIYSIGGLDDIALHSMDGMNLRYEHSMSFPGAGPGASSMICDTESITQAFNDEHLQYFDTDGTPSSLESPADLHSALNSFLMSRSVDRAQRRWRKVISVLKWFSLRRELDSKKKLLRYSK